MNNDHDLLSEAYDQVSKFIPVSPERVKFIVFPKDLEAYEVDPFKKIDLKYALEDKGVGSRVRSWSYRDLIIGEDLQDLYPSVKNINSSSWYIAPSSAPKDHIYKALLGYY
jgi:hypothetical protein